MSSMHSTASADERLSWLTEQLGSEGTVTITDAAGALGVSEMTIRRDLADLEERGLAVRIRGGARAVGPQTVAQRRDRMARAKSRVAAKLAGLLPRAGVVAFDASTTIMRLAGGLTVARDLVVLTNGPDTFNVLQHKAGVTPLLTGGQLDVRTGSLVGPIACRAASSLNPDRLFVSAAAVDALAGTAESTLEEAEVKRAMAAGAAEVIVAVDSSKLSSRAAASALAWEHINMLVTELDPSDQRLHPFRELTELR